LPPGRPSNNRLPLKLGPEDDPRPGSFASSDFQKAKLLERRDAIVETDLFRDLAILDTQAAITAPANSVRAHKTQESAPRLMWCARAVARFLKPWGH